MACPEAVFVLRLLELAAIQGVVEAALGQQLLVAALLDDLAVAHHQNQVRIADGAQPVGHHKAGAALHELIEGLLDQHLRAGIDAGGRLVQNQHGRQGQHHTGDAQELLLSAADAVLIQHGV